MSSMGPRGSKTSVFGRKSWSLTLVRFSWTESDISNVIEAVATNSALSTRLNLLTWDQHYKTFLWAAFAPKSFRQKITNPNCNLIKAVQRALVWLSILLIFYEQLFHTKVFCAAIMCLQFGFVILWQEAFGTKAALKTLVKLTPGINITKLSMSSFCAKILLPKNYKPKF
jgi:hypothetical protein